MGGEIVLALLAIAPLGPDADHGGVEAPGALLQPLAFPHLGLAFLQGQVVAERQFLGLGQAEAQLLADGQLLGLAG